jgi:glycosyltransferase involved in cell wall biosynthesis
MESIVRSVAEEGHELHVLLPQHRRWRRPAVEGGIHYHPYRYSPARSWTPWGFSGSLAGGTRIRTPLFALAPVVVASAVRAAGGVLGRGGFDLVHVHWVVPNGPIGAIAAKRHDLPLVISLHGSDMAVSERSRAIGRLTRWSFGRSAAVVAPSGDLLERARRLGAPDRVELIPHGADREAFDVPADIAAARRARLGLGEQDVVVAGVGRLIPVKGFAYLLEAHAHALADDPRLRLVLVGDGDERVGLQERARTLGVLDTVVFTGMVDRSEIPEYLAAADIVAVPSVRYDGYVDGLPTVALEAMAAGKPLVASRVGGLVELVDDQENGLLVGEKDVRALADALVRLAGEPDLRARLGARGQAEIGDQRSWKAAAQRYVTLYRSLLAAR